MTEPELRAFWDAARAELEAVPLSVQIRTPDDQPDWLVTPYEVTLTSLNGVNLECTYLVPNWPQREPLPALITFPGYAGNCQEPALAGEAGYALLILYPRGQGPSARHFRLPNGLTPLTFGLEDPAQYYYRAAYMDCVRGVDFLCSRPEVNPNRIGAFGTSQGGGLTIALAALDDRIRAAAAHVPFLCNYPKALEIMQTTPTYPYQELADYFSANPEMKARGLETLQWFDPVNLSAWVRCPTLITIGDKDDVCPPATIEPVFQNLGCHRALLRYPTLGHELSYDFRRHCRLWMDLYL